LADSWTTLQSLLELPGLQLSSCGQIPFFFMIIKLITRPINGQAILKGLKKVVLTQCPDAAAHGQKHFREVRTDEAVSTGDEDSFALKRHGIR